MFFYSLLLALVLVIGSPYWLWRMATSGRYRAGLKERLGVIPRRLSTSVTGPVIWVHAVSVGEVLAALRLIRELEAEAPRYTIVLSTTTSTGQQLAAKRLGEDRVFYYPLDFKFAVRRYLQALNPRLVVLMESELWPRLLMECAGGGIPVAVVNARISDRSLPRYRRLRALWGPLLARVRLILAQDEENAHRWVEIGAWPNRVHAIGNLKYDVDSAVQTEMVRRIASSLPERAKLVVAGSTLAGEESALLEVYAKLSAQDPHLRLLIAPRHPQRFAAAAEEISMAGFTVVRCSDLQARAGTVSPTDVLLLDTIGDLAATYSLAAVAFVGGSLVPAGGHNPLEPAQFGVPVVMGNSAENFREIVAKLQDQNALRIVPNKDDLQNALADLLQNRDAAQAMGERGKNVFATQTGATHRTVQALLGVIQSA